MSPKTFTGNFTLQEPISEEAISQAVDVMRSGRLHRYNTDGDLPSEAALLESEYADYQGRKWCLACASGGYAMQIALRASGLQQGETVLTNAFTLAPVPGAIAGAGGRPQFIEINDNLVLDLDDLKAKIKSTKSRFLMLSLMRGHLPDMDALMDIVSENNITLIEDCAHTMGASWNGKKSGNFGLAGCFSTQTYKHINSGEGGLLVSDDDEFIAKAIIYSGSYMLFPRHLSAPATDIFSDIRLNTPNCSGRMDNLRASILRPQLTGLDNNVTQWNKRYQTIERILSEVTGLHIPNRPDKEYYVGSSIQFLMPSLSKDDINKFVAANLELGVEVKWFGSNDPVGFTSKHSSWHYVEAQSLPQTDNILNTLFDMRIPLTFSIEDCQHIGEIIAFCANKIINQQTSL